MEIAAAGFMVPLPRSPASIAGYSFSRQPNRRRRCVIKAHRLRRYFFCKPYSAAFRLLSHLPVADLRQIHAVVPDILTMLHQLILHLLHQIRPRLPNWAADGPYR